MSGSFPRQPDEVLHHFELRFIGADCACERHWPGVVDNVGDGVHKILVRISRQP